MELNNMRFQCDDPERLIIAESYRIIFTEYINKLLERYQRFVEIRKSCGMCLDLETYMDIIIVQLRALLCEKQSSLLKDYSIYSWLRLIGDKESEMQLQQFMKQEIAGWNFTRSLEDKTIINKNPTIEESIRIVANRTICHYDNLEFNREKSGKGSNLNSRTYTEGYIVYLKNRLYDENCEYGIDSIIHKLSQILHVNLK